MVFSGLLHVVGESKCISKGKMVHAKMIVSGFIKDVYASNHLISMYGKSELMHDARLLFDQMPEKNVVSWTLLISGYSRTGPAEEAVNSFRSMISQGFEPNHFTYVSILSGCASIGAAMTGKEIHGRIYRVEQELLSNFLSNSLVNMYAKCGIISLARRVFDRNPQPNLVSWGSILAGCCQCGEYEEALRIFSRAREEGVEVNEFVCASTLSACVGLADPTVGKQVHCLIIKNGHGSDCFVEAGIIDMYIKCGELDLAYPAFSDLDEPGLASWNALVRGYAQQCQEEKAMDLFRKLHSSGLKPNEHTFPSILVACSNVSAVGEGKQIHSLIIKLGFKLAGYIGNAVVDLYAKSGFLEESCKVFEEMEERDIVSWNALIAGHVGKSNPEGTAELLKHMLLEGMDPNFYTYSSILSLCANLPAIGWGQQTHSCLIRRGFDINIVVGSALIDMYAKCGRLSDAREVFDRLPSKNSVSWNGMLVGYSQHGFGREALDIFDMMQRESIKPNDVTFIGVLSACGHVGLVEEGQRYFDLMRVYGTIPRIDHFACMVDLFARGGQIGRAYEFIRSMPIEPDKVIWRSLMAGCKTHGDLSTGRCAAKHILEIDPEDVSARVMLSGLYSNAGMWDERAEVRKAVKKGLKVQGCSWIEVKDRIHYFTVGDAVQGLRECIHETVNALAIQIKDAGYICNTEPLHNGE